MVLRQLQARRRPKRPTPPVSAPVVTAAVRSRAPRAAVISGGGRVQGADPRQVRAWEVWDRVPELTFGTSFIAAAIGRIEPQIGVKTAGGVEPIGDGGGKLPPDVLAAANIALEELGVGDDGLGGFVERLQLNIAVAAELWLVPPDSPGMAPWTCHSVLEAHALSPLQLDDGTRIPGGAQITFDDGSTRNVRDARRIWRPHPARASMAHGPLLVLLDVAEEVEMLVRQIKAVAMSKLINGLFVVPTELQLVSDTGAPLDLGEELDQAFKAAIRDHGSTEGVTPLIARCPADLMKAWQYITFEKGVDDGIIARLENGVMRLARGMDMPAEVVTGLGTTTHWNAREIDESLYKSFVGPQGDWLYTRLLARVIRPRVMQLLGLVETGPDGVILPPVGPVPPDVARLAIWWDEGALIAHPDKSKQALALYGTAWRPSFGISGEGVRELTGVPEHFAPTSEEIADRTATAQHLAVRETLTGQAPEDETLSNAEGG